MLKMTVSTEYIKGYSGMSYSGSNTPICIAADEGNKQSITEKLHNNIEIKDNTNKNHAVDNKKVTEKK